ncbi:MAG: hypothetical protein P794_09650 [Epsilonproteobacteria bacterium (ex Lamellibrachia satsuma)]|nr:MAG: hypothetical protein P794_09650 [Epsilonproteobacteria bacterium (ex Lamellibrachia satsuma)]
MQKGNIPEYDFDIIEMIKEGFHRIEGVKQPFVIAFLIYIAVAVVTQTFLSFFFPSPPPPSDPNLLNQQIVTILSYPVLMPLMAGIIMLAVNYSRGERLDPKSIFNYYHLVGKLSLAAILIYILTVIGFILFVLPGIYLTVAYIFVVPLIVDKNLEVWDAMELSRKVVTKNWFKIFGLILLLALIFVLGILSFGIGLIWAIPLTFVTLYGLLYPMIFDR